MKLAEPKYIYVLFIVGAVLLLARAMSSIAVENSALFYVGLPFLISFALFHLVPRAEGDAVIASYPRHLRDATIIMLATSGILQEGFLCVLFFMPIYYIILSATYLVLWNEERKRRKSDINTFGIAVPLLLLATSIEGVTPHTSFDRTHSLSQTVVTDASIAEIKANLAIPLDFPKADTAFLSIFPKPIASYAGSLQEGDVHTLDFVYKKWVVTNAKRGTFKLRIDEVSDKRVRTSVVENTAYFSAYMNIDGTQIDFESLANGQTKITLTLHYERILDPAWYFDPLQRLAMQQSADYLMTHIILREETV